MNNSISKEEEFAKSMLHLLNEFHERNLNNEDYPYTTLGLAEWLEFEKLTYLKKAEEQTNNE